LPSIHTLTNIGVFNTTTRITIEVRLALLTIATHCVVLTIVTYTTTHFAGGLVYSRVEVTPLGMTVAVADYHTFTKVIQL
jgi:hypothetical protein